MLPPASAATSGAPRPIPPEGFLVGVNPNALWYQGVCCVVSTPPSPAATPPLVHVEPTKANWFQTASRKVASVTDAVLGSTVRPPATSCQSVARSLAIAEP